jgi:hypothetical protein
VKRVTAFVGAARKKHTHYKDDRDVLQLRLPPQPSPVFTVPTSSRTLPIPLRAR